MIMSIFFLAAALLSLLCHTTLAYDPNSGVLDEDDELVVKPIPTLFANETANVQDNMACQHEDMELGKKPNPSCLVHESRCMRRVVDDLFTQQDISLLRAIAEKGMATRESVGGPTILDINTGYIRDTNGLENLFAKKNDIYSAEDFGHYGRIIHKLKEIVQQTFGIANLYFTAPTFITRLDGRSDWEAKAIHDEYWHPHADMVNTGHYHYSGLLYLSTYEEEFTGGRLIFTNNGTNSRQWQRIVEPYRGRVALFTSGTENLHYVEKVTSGQRFVLAFWFTCNADRQFEIFLDGQQHLTFSHRIRLADENKRKKAEAAAAAKEQESQSRRGINRRSGEPERTPVPDYIPRSKRANREL